ncbi:unnamed protein product [Symbiodinium natans]|uniref:Uncharacterized protein n=1 Tax=Symbiodinium natans TaxID=878477 RepID=A0A812U5X7_9DINO|nr:unnamed protein product [Symbiodinium natans]
MATNEASESTLPTPDIKQPLPFPLSPMSKFSCDPNDPTSSTCTKLDGQIQSSRKGMATSETSLLASSAISQFHVSRSGLGFDFLRRTFSLATFRAFRALELLPVSFPRGEWEKVRGAPARLTSRRQQGLGGVDDLVTCARTAATTFLADTPIVAIAKARGGHHKHPSYEQSLKNCRTRAKFSCRPIFSECRVSVPSAGGADPVCGNTCIYYACKQSFTILGPSALGPSGHGFSSGATVASELE